MWSAWSINTGVYLQKREGLQFPMSPEEEDLSLKLLKGHGLDEREGLA